MNRTRAAIVGVAIGTWMIAGCSNAAAPPPTGTPAAPATAPIAVTNAPSTMAIDVSAFIPAGSYSADIPAGLEAAPGTWTMRIDAAGLTWTNPETGATFTPGKVEDVTNSTIVFAPDPACPGQGGSATAGTYQWQLDAGQLAFTVLSDSCAGRRDTLTATPWTQVP